MDITKKILTFIIKIVAFPIFALIAILDSDIAQRLVNGRYNIIDILPHSFAALASVVVYFYIKIDCIKLLDSLPTIISFQGIIFATALATSTFILSIYRPNELSSKHPDKETTIFDILDDLRLANKIIFTSLLIIFILWFLLAMNIIRFTKLMTILIVFPIFWSMIAIKSIIKGVFKLAKIS